MRRMRLVFVKFRKRKLKTYLRVLEAFMHSFERFLDRFRGCVDLAYTGSGTPLGTSVWFPTKSVSLRSRENTIQSRTRKDGSHLFPTRVND